MKYTKCYICNALIPDTDGPVCEQDYLPQSPGCWKLYTEVLEREYGEWNYPDIHRLTVDCYAVQHPTKEFDPQSAKSVTTHLVALCLFLEKDIPLNEITSYLQKMLEGPLPTFSWLVPPTQLGEVTISDVARAATLDEHTQIVQKWTSSCWEAWSEHHSHIRAIVDKLKVHK